MRILYTKSMNTKKGFTIIETTLVLAIAGLIMLLAFFALPSLSRSQRDSERKDDIMEFANAVKKFQSNNNRGALPNASQLNTVKTSFFDSGFIDPDGSNYTLVYKDCDSNVAAGAECTTATKEFNNDNSGKFGSYKMYFIASASCVDNNKAVKSANARKAAILYRLEGGNAPYCFDL